MRTALAIATLLLIFVRSAPAAPEPDEARVRIDRIVRAGEAYEEGPRHPVDLTAEVNALLALGPEKVFPALRSALELRTREDWEFRRYRFAIETLAALLTGRRHDPQPPRKDYILFTGSGFALVLARGPICTFSDPEYPPCPSFADLCGKEPKLREPLAPDGAGLLRQLLSLADLGDDDYVTKPQVWSFGLGLGEAARKDAGLAKRLIEAAGGIAIGHPDAHPSRVLWSLDIALARVGTPKAIEAVEGTFLRAAAWKDEDQRGEWFRNLGEALRASPGGEPVLRRLGEKIALPEFDRWVGGDATILPLLEAAEAETTPAAIVALTRGLEESGSSPSPETMVRVLRVCDRSGSEDLARVSLWHYEPPPRALGVVRRILADLDGGRLSFRALPDLTDPSIFAPEPLWLGKETGVLRATRVGDRVEVAIENRTGAPLALNPLLGRYASWYENEADGVIEVTLGHTTAFYRLAVPAAALIVLAPGESHTFTVTLPMKTERPLEVGIFDDFEADGTPPATRLRGASRVEVRETR